MRETLDALHASVVVPSTVRGATRSWRKVSTFFIHITAIQQYRPAGIRVLMDLICREFFPPTMLVLSSRAGGFFERVAGRTALGKMC